MAFVFGDESSPPSIISKGVPLKISFPTPYAAACSGNGRGASAAAKRAMASGSAARRKPVSAFRNAIIAQRLACPASRQRFTRRQVDSVVA